MNNYLNTGNIFSRSFLIDDFISFGNYLIISKKNDISKYEKIFLEKNKKITQITDLSQIVSFVKNNDKSYFFDVELFNYNLPNLYEINNKYSIKLKKGDFLDIDEFFKKLNDFGYTYKDYLFENNFKKTGDIIDIISNGVNIKISLWGDVIEEIIVDKKLKNEYFIGKILDIKNMGNSIFDNKKIEFLTDKKIILDNIDIFEIYESLQKIDHISFDILKKDIKQIDLKISDFFLRDLDDFLHILKSNKNISIYTKNDKTISNFLEYNNIENVKTYKTSLNFLKSFKKEDKVFICDDNISRIFVKKRSKKTISSDLDLILQIKPGDFVVHIDHGIGIFNQITEKQVGNIKKEYLEIDYDKGDKLFVPITEINRVSKYIGTENPKITNLAGKTWSEKLAKTGKEIEIIAGELLEMFAKRQLEVGYSFKIYQDELIKFRTSFEYEYTPDQENAINEIIKDMASTKPMERLLVGDVGFGKTEVAFNAIYNSFLNKKQSVLISPLVVLSYEHYEKALERFRNFGLKIGVLTRFETPSQAKKIISDLANGDLDLIIGTHRLLGDDIKFKDLGLLIIDEEHKFGVKEKEKIKSFKSNIDVLSLSATPIPRSLNMALNGIRDISILSHPPLQRKGVETYVSKFDDNIIIQAGNREFARGGQLFFIHNRVSNIENMKEYLQSLWPDKRIITVHGQLHGNELEDRIIQFKQKKYDILLSTTVIENGIDFAGVNTIIINDAYKFGLSQIHQLRGRVGRRDILGYCYLLYKKDVLPPDGAKRLSTIVEYSHLGAGFDLAIKDLEIRGGGDILGINQSGMATQVGINVFLKMLEEKIEDLKLEKNMLTDEDEKHKRINIKIDLNIEAYLDDSFFTSEIDKLNFYKELEYIDNLDDLQNLIDDFLELNTATSNALNLFKLLKTRIVLNDYKILSIKRLGVNYEISFESNIKIEDLKKFLDKDKNVVFVVSSLDKLKVPCNKFKNDTHFLEYLYNSYVEEIK